jgi:four helix bundle protein
MRDFRQLVVWEKAHRFTLQIYHATQQFPREEIYGLSSQIRRASVSIPANIAEGCGKNTITELAHYLQIAMGSSSEVDYELMLARDLHYLSEHDYQALYCDLIEIRKMLNTFISTLRSKASH